MVAEMMSLYTVNSVAAFLMSIEEAQPENNEFEAAEKAFAESPVLYADFTEKYEQFCTKYGFPPKSVVKKSTTLKQFGLTLEKRSDNTTDCYTHIRWKKAQEERREGQVEYVRGMDSVQLFLDSCCVSTGAVYTLSPVLSYTPLLHSYHTLLSYSPLIHSSHTLLSYTPLIHSSHTLLSYTPPMHSSHAHALLSCTPLVHSHSYTPLIHLLRLHSARHRLYPHLRYAAAV
jgi:hypothetical protein